jgi:glycosyltransferase involved in cell wall biosynthesis
MEEVKIAFVSHSSGSRGAERALVDIVRLLTNAGHQCIVYTSGEGPLPRSLDLHKIAHHDYRAIPWVTDRKSFSRSMFKTAAILLKALSLAVRMRREKYDVVVSNTITIPSGCIAARINRIPHLWFVHEYLHEDHQLVFDLPDEVISIVVKHWGGRLVFNSKSVRDKWLKVFNWKDGAGSADVIYQSVAPPNIELAHSIKESNEDHSWSMVQVGALVHEKGQRDSILAIGELKRKGYRCGLALLGQGKDEANLRQLVAERGLCNEIEFCGEVADPGPWLCHADVALVCSISEAFGRVALEAMSFGVPLVVANAGGLVEIVIDERTGLVYGPGNYVELARKIEELLRDRSKAMSLAARAKEYVDNNFTEDRYLEQFEKSLAAATVCQN